ncbi:hypothetical protein, partial [Burkholderia ubonensis]|uniref:hypothetical protein n=1 Tax=Burkholderia ubonensis TaxID=101571 RepID=UPI000AAE8F3B
PTLHTDTRLITENTKGQPVRFPIPPEELSVLNGGTVLVTYSVYPIAGNGPFEPREGTRYRVGEAGALLPPPEVDYLDVGSGVLDPDRVPEWGTFLTVPKAANTMRGDDVTVYWRGRTGGPSDSFEDSAPVSDATAGDALPFPIEKRLVTANLDANVTARYVIMRDGDPLPSEPRTFRVGAAQVEVPTIRSIEDAAGNEIQDTYSVVTPTVKLSGTASIRQQVQILDGGNEMATVRADDNGNWETTYLPVSTKRYEVKVRGLYGSPNPEGDADGETVGHGQYPSAGPNSRWRK